MAHITESTPVQPHHEMTSQPATPEQPHSVGGGEIAVRNVSKSFGEKKVLDNVSLDIKRGEFFSLLGPSGCGKTTLLRIIGGFEDPSSGDLFIDGKSVIDLPPNKRHVNTVFQNYALFPHLTVYENVAFPLRLRKVRESVIREEVMKFLCLVQLDANMDKYPSQLSGGMKQRVSIARALINHPSVLLLDEPLSALDAKLRQHMLIELDTLHDTTGLTFIYVTHDQEEALSVSDRIAIMSYGKILQIGTPSEIYESPADTFVADFIGAANFLEGTVIAVTETYAQIDVVGVGQFYVELDKPVAIGDRVKTTIRPEKIRITKNKPERKDKILNVIAGTVDELIYSGASTKYFVKAVNTNYVFQTVRQHIQFYTTEIAITWRDRVFISWDPDDGYIVEVSKP